MIAGNRLIIVGHYSVKECILYSAKNIPLFRFILSWLTCCWILPIGSFTIGTNGLQYTDSLYNTLSLVPNFILKCLYLMFMHRNFESTGILFNYCNETITFFWTLGLYINAATVSDYTFQFLDVVVLYRRPLESTSQVQLTWVARASPIET